MFEPFEGRCCGLGLGPGYQDKDCEASHYEDTYLPAFEATLADGRASGLMCSYNAVNGVPSCANGDALGALARGSWGFDGYVTSDCGAVAGVTAPFPNGTHAWPSQVYATGHGYAVPDGASLASLGLDLNCNLGGGAIARGRSQGDRMPSQSLNVALVLVRGRLRVPQRDVQQLHLLRGPADLRVPTVHHERRGRGAALRRVRHRVRRHVTRDNNEDGH